MKKILIEQYGEPEVLQYIDAEIPIPGPNEVLVNNYAIGVNFTDIYGRIGAFDAPKVPFTPGKEGAGVIIGIGENVKDFSVGDRVAYIQSPGAYAEKHVVSSHYTVHLPPEIDFTVAASVMLKGLTAQYLIRKTFPIKKGDIILMHAAAGGVGTILVQWAKSLGAIVIGTVGSKDKVSVAYENGCDYVIQYKHEDIAEKVSKYTNGRKCDVVYDGIGKDTFISSLDSLKPFGYFVNFGFASGPIAPFDLRLLAEKGSLFATFPDLTEHLAKREDIIAMSNDLFNAIKNKKVNILEPFKLQLKDAAKAHKLLENRQTMGSTILLP